MSNKKRGVVKEVKNGEFYVIGNKNRCLCLRIFIEIVVNIA